MSWLVPRIDLTPDQIRAVELPTNEAKVILGVPGSGKTQILLHRADHLRHSLNVAPDRFRIFLFTNVLRDYIRSALHELGIPEECVSTFDHWCRLQYEAHISKRLPWSATDRVPDFEAIRARVLEFFQSHSMLRYRMQFILADEGQDLTEQSYRIMKLAAQHVTVCADPLQQIYSGASEGAILRVLDLRRRNATLLGAYRNSPDVGRLAAYFIPDTTQASQYLTQLHTANVQREKPVLFLAHSHDEEMDHLANVIRERQRLNERVGILVPQNRFVHGYAQALAERGIQVERAVPPRRGDQPADFANSTPKIATYYSAKGLTFDSVLLPRLVDGSFGRSSAVERSRLLFVGMTRATRWIHLSKRKDGVLAEMPYLLRAASENHLYIQDGEGNGFARSGATMPSPDDDLLIGL